MKQKRFTLALIFVMFVGLASHAQDVITGNHLNIGSGNELNSQYYGGAIGIQNSCTGATSLVVGYKDTIPDGSTNSFVAGAHNRIIGVNSFAMGGNVKVLGATAIGLGYYLKARNENNFIMGWGVKGNNTNPDKFMENNYPFSLMIGLNSTKPTLTVGPSPNDYPNGNLIFDRTGKVAIGDVPVPEIAAKLHIRSDEGEDAGIFLEPKDLENGSTFIRMRDDNHGIEVDSNGEMTITAVDNTMNLQSTHITLTGKVGINILNESDTYALAVNGGILTNEMFIKNVDEWYDNVFDKDYKLLSLIDLKHYISEYDHLPEVPSETEVLAEGYKMAEMQGLLLKKIEELTLYTLKQQEEIEMLKQAFEELKGK